MPWFLFQAVVIHTEAVLCEQMVQMLNDNQLKAQILRNGAAKELDVEAVITL